MHMKGLTRRRRKHKKPIIGHDFWLPSVCAAKCNDYLNWSELGSKDSVPSLWKHRTAPHLKYILIKFWLFDDLPTNTALTMKTTKCRWLAFKFFLPSAIYFPFFVFAFELVMVMFWHVVDAFWVFFFFFEGGLPLVYRFIYGVCSECTSIIQHFCCCSGW